LIQIVEVIGRSEQGQTRPFLCLGGDGLTYYVKGRGAGRRSQLCEWTAGNLAAALGLPIAPFQIVNVPAALVRMNVPDLALDELGSGSAFGSAKVVSSVEFAISDLARVALEMRRDIFLFDWWIRNDDRTLTEKGGNPNLLWDAENRRAIMIDHNLAYNDMLNGPLFIDTHVFGREREAMWSDLVWRLELSKRFLSVLPAFDQACDNAPEEWWFEDESSGVPANFDRLAVRAVLERAASEAFWKIEP
jgi:hypothetical protein